MLYDQQNLQTLSGKLFEFQTQAISNKIKTETLQIPEIFKMLDWYSKQNKRIPPSSLHNRNQNSQVVQSREGVDLKRLNSGDTTSVQNS